MKPSDFPRDLMFRDPSTPPFLEERDGQVTAHVFSYADAQRVLVNRGGEFSKNARAWLPPGRQHGVWYFMWTTDPGSEGRHDALRGLVDDWFRRRAVTVMRPLIQTYARQLVRRIVEKGTGTFNLAQEFAYRLSMQTICGLVGVPIEREEWLRHELQALAQAADVMNLEVQYDVESFFWETVAKRLAHPEDELLDRVVAGWAAGTIDDLELLGFMWGFYGAGTDTAGTGVVDAFAISAEFDQLDYLRQHLDDEHALATAAEEIIRFSTPFPTVLGAFTTRPVTFGELEVPPYTPVQVHIAAANRGVEVNGKNVTAKEPDVLDLRRSPNQHLGFAVGVHHCLGAALSQLEIITAWRELLHYLPDLTLDTSQPFERYAGLAHGVTDAHFFFGQRKAEQLLGL